MDCILLISMLATSAYTITPVARTDVVPYQRIDNHSSFKFGVVAFSKPGIERVDFTISGQGYSCSATSPETCVDGTTKRITSTRLNTRVASAQYPGVWEYYVTLDSSEFSSNGTITVTPTVTDNESNTRMLTPTILIVEGASSDFGRRQCWVSGSTSDGNGTVDSESDPFPTLAAAVSACQSANNGNSAGNIVYLDEGVYAATAISAMVSGEWLTITKYPTADRANVVVRNNGGGKTNTNWLKFDNVTLKSECSNCRIAGSNDEGAHLWTNRCRKMGAGRYLDQSNPIMVNRQSDTGADLDGYYSTDDYTYDVHYAYRSTDLIRGAVVEQVRDDVFENFQFVVNCKINNVHNGSGYGQTPVEGGDTSHSDVLQVYQTNPARIPVENRLAYNVYATDVHYQGIMRSATSGVAASNNAFVNVFIEMRDVGTDGDPSNGRGNDCVLAGGLGLPLSGEDHLLVWHCSFPYAHVSGSDTDTNSSFIGNLFFTYRHSGSQTATTEYNYNHYQYSIEVGDSCQLTSHYDYKGWVCPRSGDHIVGANYSTGAAVVDISTPGHRLFGYPIAGAPIVDALPNNLTGVPCDALGKIRDATPDVGALEYQPSSTTGPAIFNLQPTAQTLCL